MNSSCLSDGDPFQTPFPLKVGAQRKPVSCVVILFYSFRALGKRKTSTFCLPQINQLLYSSHPLKTEALLKKEKKKRNVKKKGA